MTIRLGSILLTAGAWFGIGFAWSAAQTTAVQIPPVHGTTLSGDKVDLPDALKGKVGVLVVGFSHESRDNVAAWGKRIAGDYKGSAGVLYYEMPMLESVPGMLRGFVTKKIAEAVPDAGKSRFVPVADHEKDWKKITGYKGGDDAYLVVVDSMGMVRWKLQGAASDANEAELKRQVEAAR
jgi:hypothetical protein